jgi:hypothetical protein
VVAEEENYCEEKTTSNNYQVGSTSKISLILLLVNLG